jgi:membrane associated rhomboid family serine protease
MHPPDPPDPAAGGAIPADLSEAGEYPTAAAGFDHGLAVLALGFPYWLVPGGAGYRLLVEPDALAAVREELACYDREAAGWPPAAVEEERTRRGMEFLTPLLWGAAVYAVFFCQGVWPGRWERLGALDSQALFGRGEWWRAGTALFLHADFGHLVSNELSGIFTFSAVATTMGVRRGWTLLALASVAGNLAIAAVHSRVPYTSIGASTAVFAGLGLMTGRAIRRVWDAGRPRPWRPVFFPLGAGITLLGLFGAGGVEVDVGAHLAGFVSGVILGFAYGLTSSALERA